MKLAIFGYGGHAREVAAQINQPVTFFVDDEYSNENAKPISSFDPSDYKMIIAVADPRERNSIANKLPKKTSYFTFIHPTAQIMDKNIEIGRGSFIGANSILTTNVKIGDHSILNRGNQIGHDCLIGNFFSAMPGSIVSGNVCIGDRCYLGTNSSIIEKKKLLHDILIGANSVVIRDIVEPGRYAGTPVRKIK